MEIKKGTKLKLKWQFLNEGEPVSLSDFSKFRLDVLDVRSVPQRTSVALSDNEAVFTIDTAKYENGRYSVCVDADGPNGGLHICHRNAFRIVPANAKSSLAKGGNGANIELTIQDDLSGQTQQGGALVVKITPGEQGYSANKTLLQVKDAYSNGIPVVFQVGGGNEAEAYWANMYDAEYFAEGNIFGFYLRRTVRTDSSNPGTIQLAWASNNGQEYFYEDYITSREVELTNENTTVEQDPTTGLTKITVANASIGSIQGSRVLIRDLQGIESSNGLYPSLAHYSSGSIVLYVAYPVTAQMLNGAKLMSTFD